MTDPAIHVSQWGIGASKETNDCGPACCAGFILARGHKVTVDELAAINPGELTSAEQLQTILSRYNIPSRIDRRRIESGIQINAEPWSILLVNYTPLRKYAQDVNYTGWHWLIYVGQDPHDPTLSIVLDPDYGLRGLPASEGDHKRYPTEALAAAFRPYSGTTTTAVYVTDLNQPTTDPVEVVWTKRYVNSLPKYPKGINVRTGPGTQYSLIGSYQHGDEVEVVLDSLDTSGYIKSRIGWINSSFLVETDPDAQPDWKVRYVRSPFPLGINTRIAPGLSSPILGSGYPNDTKIEVNLSKVVDGYVQDKSGLWVALQYLAELPPDPVPPDAFVTRYVKATPYLNVRSAPIIADDTLVDGASLEFGAEIQVNMGSLTNGFVQMPNRNWVYAFYLDTRRPPSPPVPPQPIPTPDPGSPGSRVKHKIGVHIVSTQTPHALIWDMVDKLKAYNKTFGAICVNTDVGLANALVNFCPHGTMFRMVWNGYEIYDPAVMNRMSDQDAENFGYNFYYGAHYHSTWQLDKRIYVKIVNECSWHPRDWAFWIGAMKAANKDGRKLAIFGDSLGTPKTARFDNGVEEWGKRVPALRFAVQHGHIVTLNQYSRYKRYDSNPNNLIESEYPVSDDEAYEYYGGRHEEFYRVVPADCRPDIIIGETGPSNSRRSYDTDFVINDMERYDVKLRVRPFGDKVKGYCYWTLGKWFDNSIDQHAPAIVDLIKRVG